MSKRLFILAWPPPDKGVPTETQLALDGNAVTAVHNSPRGIVTIIVAGARLELEIPIAADRHELVRKLIKFVWGHDAP